MSLPCLLYAFLGLLISGRIVSAAESVHGAGDSGWSGNVQQASGTSLWWQYCNGTPPDDAQSVILLENGQMATFNFTGSSVQVWGMVVPVTTCSMDFQTPSTALNRPPPSPPPRGADCVPTWYPAMCNTVLAEYTNLDSGRPNAVYIAPKDARVAIFNAVVQSSGPGTVSAPSNKPRPPPSSMSSTPKSTPTPTPTSAPSPPPSSPLPSSPSSTDAHSFTSTTRSESSSPFGTISPSSSPASSGITSRTASNSNSATPDSDTWSHVETSSSSTVWLPARPSSTDTSSPHSRVKIVLIIVPLVLLPFLLCGAIFIWMRQRRRLARKVVSSSNQSFFTKEEDGSWLRIPSTPGPPYVPGSVTDGTAEPQPGHLSGNAAADGVPGPRLATPPLAASQSSTMRGGFFGIRDSLRDSRSMIAASDVIAMLDRFITSSKSEPAMSSISFGPASAPPTFSLKSPHTASPYSPPVLL